MKTIVKLFVITLFVWGCSKSYNNGYYNPPPPSPMIKANYQQTNLVTDTSLYPAAHQDPHLLNAWGIAIHPSGIVWISANHAGASTVYDSTGKTLFGPVAIQSQGKLFGGSPSGIVYNGTADFLIPSNHQASKFIIANEDGTSSAWGGGDSAATVADRSASGAVYKGICLANDGTGNFLYAANFKQGTIDVFDRTFNIVTTKPFSDPSIPTGFGPFNVANLGGKLYVSYAKLKAPDNMDDQAGPGNGFIDVYDPGGKLLHRLVSQGQLNSPWGMAQAPQGFGLPFHSILIGNFGDGTINVFDSTGVYLGQLQNNGSPVTIPGLWALDFPSNEVPSADPNKLYFTAGPMGENHGLFGFLKMQ